MSTMRKLVRIIPTPILASARVTADTYGVAHIGITKTAPCSRRWHVTTSRSHGHYTGHPVVWVATVNNHGQVTAEG